MDNKFLIIGNNVVSSALVQVMVTLASSQFIRFDSANFSNAALLLDALEGHREDKDIQGIVLLEPDGVELSKHIRLTDMLGRLSLLHLLVISPHSVDHHLSEKADNVFLLSPGCQLIQVSNCIPELLAAMKNPKCFTSPEEMKKAIRPFVIWSEEDDIISRHDNFNRYGPFKLMKEHYRTLPERLERDYSRMTSSLWFKKYHFLEAVNSVPIGSQEVDEYLFGKTIANKRVLYIDDEHRLGWSFALYSILTGNSSPDIFGLFQGNERTITSPDSRFTCIDTYEDASNLFELKEKEFAQAIRAYSEAEYRRNIISGQHAAERAKFNRINTELSKAKEDFERSEKNLTETEIRVKESGNSLKKHVMDLLDEATRGNREIEVVDISPSFKSAKDVFEQYEKENSLLSRYKDEHKRNRELLEKLTTEHAKQLQSLEQVKSENSIATKRYDEACKALLPGRLFPYDLVILDLRLERIKDKDGLPHEISGVKLLKQIMEYDPSIPVIIFTASEKAVNYREVTDFGASGYWIKSINTLVDLKAEIIRTLSRVQEIRRLWFDIKKVEVKRQLTFIRENPGTRSLEKSHMSDAKKAEIVILLKESFLLLIRESTPYEESVCNYTNHAKVVLNMGMIQEERFGRLHGEKWDQWVRQKKIDADEAMIRQIRNKAAHQAGSNISYQEAISVFQKTLERCLRN